MPEKRALRSRTKVMPGHLRSTITGLYRPLYYRGSAVECPCCGGSFRSFVPHRGRPNVRCPRCGSMERHRLLWLWLVDEPVLKRDGLEVLHVAPEPVLQRLLRALPRIRYTGGDLESRLADVHFDVTSIPFDDGRFDLVLCNHVLEHVPDDEAAMRELRRVLAADGLAILMTPIARDRLSTLEDASITEPEERLARFGQEDHARLYGDDYDERLRRSGFKVERVDLLATLPEDLIRRHGLRQEHSLFADDVVHVGRPA